MRRTVRRHKRRGIALFAAMIFIAVFMAVSAGMLAMSSQNAIAASNLQTGNLARSTAESGLELTRYWMRNIIIPGSVKGQARYDWLVAELQSALQAASINCQMIGDDLHIGSVTLDGASGRFFTATVERPSMGMNADVAITINGQAGGLSRGLLSGFTFGESPQEFSVFDFGVATKGPLKLLGNTALDGVSIASESDVYIESLTDNDALSIEGNSQIAGKVSIANPDAEVTLKGGQSSIGGERGQDAMNHVTVGVTATDFPYPNAGHFESYATGGTLTAADSALFSQNITLENVRIAAGTNPKFTSNVTIKGIMYIESPNEVDFGGNVTITGLIVGDGDMEDHSQTNTMVFRGNVNSQGVRDLPDEPQFDGLRGETGTFLMAPGFFLSFGGNFGTVNGTIAGNGVEFFGNAGGTIEGSVINYSPNPMTVTGNSDLYFNRTGIEDTPAGFEIINDWVIHYSPTSYTEVLACGI